MPGYEESARHPEDLRMDEEEETPAVVHDDIMKRLLDYQRQLREGATGREVSIAAGATVTETEALVDLSGMESDVDADARPGDDEEAAREAEADEVVVSIEATSAVVEPAFEMPAAPDPSAFAAREPIGVPARSMASPDVEARITRLERTLERLGSRIGELRRSFQDLAVAADQRLSQIENEISQARIDEPKGS
jgi:TolA-binding protein